MSRARAPRDGAGFTLLEVMVALAVLAMSLTAVSDVVGGALQNHLRARQLEVATMLARAKLGPRGGGPPRGHLEGGVHQAAG